MLVMTQADSESKVVTQMTESFNSAIHRTIHKMMRSRTVLNVLKWSVLSKVVLT